MNVDQIYQLQRDDAFARQFSATEYSTFVAMPFNNRGGYPEARIKKLLETVHEQANGLVKPTASKRTRPKFAELQRIDTTTFGAVVITDEIVRQILQGHFFFGDLTGCNFGVVLEAGIALALKPNRRVILFTQDDTASLHFDLKVTKINRYDEDNLVQKLAKELVEAADAFDNEADKYIRLLSSRLTPDGILALNTYGRLWKDRKRETDQPAIWEDSAEYYRPERFGGPAGKIAFHNSVRELSDHRLFWTQYVPAGSQNGDSYGVHATALGWRVIEHIWQHDPKMSKPDNAPTAPNL